MLSLFRLSHESRWFTGSRAVVLHSLANKTIDSVYETFLNLIILVYAVAYGQSFDTYI